ncbi:MAG: ABC transporter permease subunit [Planctomycetes bacterium]|nr:ABC transporter permease subunit [Planctomycetota bacterium]
MRNLAALVRRELGVYFVSPMAYIILTGLILVFGLMFWTEMGAASDFAMPFSFDRLLATLAAILVFVAPLITMRLIAEEKNRGTIETLMTAPVTDGQVVVAKFAAALLFLMYLLLPTVAHAFLAAKYGTVDAPATATGYLGLILMCSAVFSIGLFISSLCSSQVTAGVVTFVVSFLLILSSLIADRVPADTWYGRPARAVLERIDPFKYLEDFLRGIIDTRPVIYLLSVTVFFIFLTVRVLESRRWR